MSGDVWHHAGETRPTRYLPLLKFVITHSFDLGGHNVAEPFYHVADLWDGKGMYENPTEVQKSLLRLKVFDGNRSVVSVISCRTFKGQLDQTGRFNILYLSNPLDYSIRDDMAGYVWSSHETPTWQAMKKHLAEASICQDHDMSSTSDKQKYRPIWSWINVEAHVTAICKY